MNSLSMPHNNQVYVSQGSYLPVSVSRDGWGEEDMTRHKASYNWPALVTELAHLTLIKIPVMLDLICLLYLYNIDQLHARNIKQV